MTLFYRHVAALLLAITLFAPSVEVLLYPKQAEAVFGVGDTVIEVGEQLFTNLIQTYNTTQSLLKDSVLDGIAWGIVNTIIASILSSTVDWINSGFEGKPAFVTDFGQFLLDTDLAVLDRFINSDLAELCSPFKVGTIRIAISKTTPFKKRAACTLGDAVGNIENFVNGNFQEGGWKGWFELTMNDQNNPYGLAIMVSTELERQTQEERDKALFEINQGKGFLSLKTCVAKDKDGKCLQKQITLPGATIESTLEKTLGLPEDRLVVADEINEVVTALAYQLINTMLTKGLTGLSNSSNGEPSYTDQVREDGGSDINELGPRLITAMEQTRNDEEDFYNLKKETLTVVRDADNAYGSLIACYTNLYNRTPPLATQQELVTASTTRANQVVPYRAPLVTEVASSNSTLATLEDLLNEAQNAASSADLSEIATTFQELQPHSRVDVLYAQEQNDELIPVMEELLNGKEVEDNEGNTHLTGGVTDELAACRARIPATAGVTLTTEPDNSFDTEE